MKHLSRALCALLTLSLLFGLLVPLTAHADSPAALSASEAVSMQQADSAIRALTDSDAFDAMSDAARLAAAQQLLAELADARAILPGSVYYDAPNAMLSYQYTCGVRGGVMLRTEEEDLSAYADTEALSSALEQLQPENGELSALIIYAFDDPEESNRFPYYQLMMESWTEYGMPTSILALPTVRALRSPRKADLYLLASHGAYYTYRSGLFARSRTTPIVLLRENSSPLRDISYGYELLSGRVIKVNGRYAVTPSFFRYSANRRVYGGSIFLSEACDFTGLHAQDNSMAEALISLGVDTVVGFHNTVYTVYSRDFMWNAINQLLMGDTVQGAVNNSRDVYGENDVIWHDRVSTVPSHSPAAYSELFGNPNRTLY